MSVDDPKVIDFVATTKDGEVELVMVEGRPWDGSPERLFELQEKVDTYLGFALYGELQEKYPDLTDRPKKIVLMTSQAPDPATADLIERMQRRASDFGISIVVDRSLKGHTP